jgi:sirohydrochlorin ferrochelatase
VTPPDATAAVVIAHGSRAEAANDAHRDVCAALAERTGGPVLPAFLELAEPTLDDAVARLVADGATRVVVLPYFLYPGRHIQRDIPALVDGARAANPAVTIEVGQLFGADPAVLDLLATQLSLAAGPDAAEDR